MNRVVKILMERDGMTKQEAIELVRETREMIFEDMDNADDIILDNLGLEPDYIMDIIEGVF